MFLQTGVKEIICEYVANITAANFQKNEFS